MTNEKTKYVVCVHNEEYTASLERSKIYQVIPDADAETHGMLRLVDESGEDYLYPQSYFAAVRLPQKAQRAVAAVA